MDWNRPDDGALQRALEAFPQPGPAGIVHLAPASVSWPSWLHWLAFLPILPVVGWAVATFMPAVRASLANPTEHTKGVQAQLPVDSIAARTVLPPERRLARRIGWTAPVAGRRVHAERSIRATLGRGGYLTPVMRLRPRVATYVFLVHRRRRDDHERERVSRLIDALHRGGLSLDVYDYDPDPRRLFARRAAAALDSEADGRPPPPVLDLRGLRELHPEARLVVVSDGSELVDFFTRRALPFVREELAAWPMRMLLTPVPIEEWGEREMNISDAMGAMVGRATPEGFHDLADAFGERSRLMPRPAALPAVSTHSEAISRLVTWLGATLGWITGPASFGRRPKPLRLEDPLLTSHAEPPGEEQEALVGSLRAWLGSRGFQWLAACAFYPELRFAVTLYLGLKITLQRGPIAQPLYNETSLAQLCLLPWFRLGHMPPWLRRALFAALPEAGRERARAAIRAMINERSGPARTSLPIWMADARGLDIPPDAVMVDFLMRDVSDLAPKLEGEAASELLREHARRALITRAAALAVTALWCLALWYFWPRPADSPHPAGAWLPLMALVGGSAAAGVVAYAARGLAGWFRPSRYAGRLR